jgi:hypothetical protein
MFRKSLFTEIMAPKFNSSDAGSASKPKRSRDVLSISERVKILGMIEIENKYDVEIARLYGKKEKHDFYCLIIIMGIQPLGRFRRNQSPVRRLVWL